MAHFVVAVQHIAHSNLKFTDFLSRNPVGGAAIEEKYEEKNVINILTGYAALNAKDGSLFDNQSNSRTEETEKEQKQNRNENEQKKNQSQTNATFENKLISKENTTPGQSGISTAKSSSNSKIAITKQK